MATVVIVSKMMQTIVMVFSLCAARDARHAGSYEADQQSRPITGHGPQGMMLHARKQVALIGLHGMPCPCSLSRQFRTRGG